MHPSMTRLPVQSSPGADSSATREPMAHSSQEDHYRQLLQRWLKGHGAACDFILQLFAVLHVWDDLIDRDKPISTKDVHTALWHALISLPRNRFYAENFSLLNGLLQTAILNWHVANRFEAEDDAVGRHVAFVIRSTYVDLVTMCAWIVGGNDWALTVGYEARKHASSEGMIAYLESLQREHRSESVFEV